MSLTPIPSRTVKPQPQLFLGCGCSMSLSWPQKNPFSLEDFYLDISADCLENNTTVAQFSYAITYTDGMLDLEEQATIGNVFGALFLGGTASYIYGVRVQAILADGKIIAYDISLPMGNQSAPYPVATNRVTLNGAVLTYAGRTLPVVNGP